MQAEEIMRFALFKEVPKRQRRKKRKATNGIAVRKGEEDAEGSSEEESDDDETEEQRMSTPAPAPQTNQTRDPIWGEDTQDIEMDVEPQAAAAPAAPVGPTADGKIRQDRFVKSM